MMTGVVVVVVVVDSFDSLFVEVYLSHVPMTLFYFILFYLPFVSNTYIITIDYNAFAR